MKQSILLILVMSLSMNVFGQDEKVVPSDTREICPVLVGENLPNAVVKDLEGEEIEISELTKRKPSIIVLYRGGWCPYCNTHLAELNEIEEQINDLGFQVLAVSPDSPEELNKTKEKGELGYSLLSDADMNLAQALGVAYKIDEKTVERYKGYGIELEKSKFQLPTPAVFVVDEDGVIQFSFVNPNYKVRLNKDILLAVLKTVK